MRVTYVLALVVGDAASISVAFLLGYLLFGALEVRPNRVPAIAEYTPTLAFLVGSLIVTFALMRLYLPRRGVSHTDQLGSIFIAVTVGNVVAMGLAAFTFRGLDVPRVILVSAWGLSILLVWLTRSITELALRAARRLGLDPEPVIVVGHGEAAQVVLNKIASAPDLGYQVEGIVVVGRVRPPVGGPPVLGALRDLPALLAGRSVKEVVVAEPSLTHAEILDIVSACDEARVSVKVFPDVFQLAVGEVGASELSGLPMLRVRDVNLRGWNSWLKRALDIVGSATLLVLFAPVMIAIAVAVKLSSPNGPVFFIQERVGVDGRPFLCVKFRSMRPDAEVATGPVWAMADDDRTTPLGRVLRRFSMDELPQLVNVLLGDMSLVGPRPERPHFVEQFRRLIPRYEKRHQEKAGMTGWAQVNGLRGQTPIEERTLYDLFYVEHWSPAFDLKILIKTIAAVIRGKNAY